MSEQPPAQPLPERVAAAVLGHPAVVRLDGGPFGSVASYLPGRRVVGVRADEAHAPDTTDATDRTVGGATGEPVEVAVVVRWPAAVSLPVLAEEIAALVREVAGERPVDVTVADLVPAPEPVPAAGSAPVAGAVAGPPGSGPPTRPGPAGTPGARLA
ncbi:hypothetical protein LWC35_15710 [Pseudonocardia kujensis]|uniref:hypothetical protein n=1 Tax=Pseudonocardia kujensis TaxID=1128675 RepID=UPI001E4357FE|nr:hypothetical protein [Pseudonocardia kujensis]MCE0764345.1 hypothetical protein [Pseudonocardia kujensis]